MDVRLNIFLKFLKWSYQSKIAFVDFNSFWNPTVRHAFKTIVSKCLKMVVQPDIKYSKLKDQMQNFQEHGYYLIYTFQRNLVMAVKTKVFSLSLIWWTRVYERDKKSVSLSNSRCGKPLLSCCESYTYIQSIVKLPIFDWLSRTRKEPSPICLCFCSRFTASVCVILPWYHGWSS